MTGPAEGETSLKPFLTGLGRHLQAATADALKARKTKLQIGAAADTAATAYEDAVAGLAKWVPPERELACRQGCTHCCHLTVLADAATVLRIARHIQETFDAAARARLDSRIADRQSRHTTLEQPARQLRRDPCPLLEDDRCTAYAVRPLICRSFNSMDLATCEREILGGGNPEGIDAWRIPWLVGLAVNEGLMSGLLEAGYGDGDIELVQGLAIALARPDAAERWLAGEPVFAAARWRVDPG